MSFFAAVGGAQDRYLFVREAEGFCRAGEEQGNSLERFGRGAYVGIAFRVTGSSEDVPLGVADDPAAPVNAFYKGSAPDRGQGRVFGQCGGEVF